MVKLFCAVVGEADSAFEVEIDEGASVSALKDAVKTKINYSGPVYKLKFFLAKTTTGAWLTEADVIKGVSDAGGYKHLEYTDAELRDVGLDSGDLGEADEQEDAEGRGPVHVLAQLPDQGQQLGENVQDSFQMHRQTIIEQKRIQAQLELVMDALPHKVQSPTLIRCWVDVSWTDWKETDWSSMLHQMRTEQHFGRMRLRLKPMPLGMRLTLTHLLLRTSPKYYIAVAPFATKSIDLKPRGFATHPAMFRVKPVPNDGVERDDRFKFRFGVAEKALFDCAILFESKLTISDAAFGQVVRYLESFCPKGPASAILFDTSSFWLIRSYKFLVVKVEKTMWIRKGSKELFQNFITKSMSPWVARLTNACFSLNVVVEEGNAFLGRGAFGRVFKVRQGQNDLALKIVEQCSVGSLYQEMQALENAQGTNLTTSPVGEVIEIRASTADNAVIGAALLMSPVGHPLPRPTIQEEVQDLFRLLWQLHAKGLAHGDPRVPNVIVSEGKSLWIDLVEVRKVSTALKQIDAAILTRSILSLPQTVSLDPTLEKLIDNYGHSSTQENLYRLAEAAWSLLPK